MARDLLARLPSLRRLVMRTCAGLADLAPLGLARVIGYNAGFTAWLLDVRGRRIVSRNLSAAIPDHEARLRAVRRSYTEFALTLVEAARLHRMPVDWSTEPYLHICDPWRVFAKPPLAGPAILVSVHSHWDMLAALGHRLGWVPESIAPALAYGDPALDHWLAVRRASWGCRTVATDRAPLALLRALREKRVLGLLVDRDYTGRGVLSRFLGRPCHLPSGPAALSVQTGAPVIPLFLARRAPCRFTLFVGKPLLPNQQLPRGGQVTDLTHRIADATTRLLAAAPAQWVAFHKTT